MVGGYGWFVVGQDYSYHLHRSELAAIKDYDVGCFYLPGAQASRWEIMRYFARCYDGLIERAETTERPFIYRISKTNRFTLLRL